MGLDAKNNEKLKLKTVKDMNGQIYDINSNVIKNVLNKVYNMSS